MFAGQKRWSSKEAVNSIFKLIQSQQALQIQMFYSLGLDHIDWSID